MNLFSIICCALSIGLSILSIRLSRKAKRLNKSLSDEIALYENRLTAAADELNAYQKALYEVERHPEGCKPGNWCSVCNYGKPVVHTYGRYGTVRATACKFGACKNFSAMEEEAR